MNAQVIPIFPVEASADGKRNAFYHHCSAIGENKAFAVCCHLIEQRKKGRLNVLYEDCSVAISKKLCPALKMRKEEVEAGQAIYFRERIKTLGQALIDTANRVIEGFKSASKTDSPKSVPETKSSLISKIDDTGFEAVITTKAAEASVKQPAPVATERPPMLPGESMFDYAKRIRNLNK